MFEFLTCVTVTVIVVSVWFEAGCSFTCHNSFYLLLLEVLG